MGESTSNAYDLAFAPQTGSTQSADIIPLFRGDTLYALTGFSTNLLLGPNITVGNAANPSNTVISYYTTNTSMPDGKIAVSGGTNGQQYGATYAITFNTVDFTGSQTVLIPTANTSATNLNTAASIGYVQNYVEANGGSGGSGGTISLTPQVFTATANQKTFNVSYTPGQISVYINGILLNPNSEYGATTGTSITIATGITVNSGDEIIVLPLVASSKVYAASRNVYTFTATANQASVATSYPYVVGNINVYLNGLLLNSGVDYTAPDGVNVNFSTSVQSTISAGAAVIVESFGTTGTQVVTPSQLSIGTGSQSIGYLAPFTNSIFQSLYNKLGDTPTLFDFGAIIDGKTDNINALNAYLSYYINLSANNSSDQKYIYVEIPPGVMAISNAPQNTGAYNIMIRGKGQMVSTLYMLSGGNGVWVHGTPSNQATGIFQLKDITLKDANGSGSGSSALQLSFSESATQDYNTLTMDNVEFRSFSSCGTIVDMPRNCYATNVLCYGPDNTYQKNGAFIISTTNNSKLGNFTFVWTRVMSSNYMWGWDISSVSPCEGHRYYSCTCYNGWGMIRANMSDTANSIALGDYQPPIWYINDCDWQGYGYALDLCNVRNVVVNKGFYFPNVLNTSSYSEIPNDPSGNARTYRRIFSFTGNSGNIILRDVEFDNGGNSYNSVDTIVYVASTVGNFRAYSTMFVAPDPCLAAFEYEAGGSVCRCAAMNSQWSEWGGKIKILDYSNNQVNQEAVDDRAGSVYIGTVTESGRYSIANIVPDQTANSDNQVSITFPTRIAYDTSNGTLTTAPLFIGGTPIVNMNVLNSTSGDSAVSVTLVSVTDTGYTFEYQGSSSSGYQADIYYTAAGQ